MWRRTLWAVLTPLVLAALIVLPSGERAIGLRSEMTELRVGYFATILHAPAIVGLGEGTFQAELGGILIVPRLFHAGPALIEALFAGEIDLAYVGPNPAINAWVRSHGQAIRIVAGSTQGGEGFVARPDWHPISAADYIDRRLGSPQIGNTQDISLRRYLSHLGISDSDVQVVSPGNSELFGMFSRGDIDGAWVAEPWLTRLTTEAKGHILHAPHDVYTAYVVVRPELLELAPDVIETWLRVHVSISERLNSDVAAASHIIAAQLSEVWKSPLSSHVVELALQEMHFLWDVSETALEERANYAFHLGYLGSGPPRIKGIVDRHLLEKALLSRDHHGGERDKL